MKKLLFAILIFIPALLRGADYYIAPYPTGNNSTGNGSSGAPWATLSYALSQGYVNTYGNTIHLADGSYSESGRLTISTGVHVRGESQAGTILTLTYANTTSSDGCFYLYSSSLTSGNQSISYMTLRGSNLTGGKAIWVGYRQYVELHHLTIEDFRWAGIHFRNQPGWMTPPAVYASGNSVHDVTITNCSDRAYASYDFGNLRIDGQQDMEIYNCYFENTERAAGRNGNIFNFTNNRDIKLHHSTFKKNDSEGSEWNFFSEIFHCQGGFETYECEFIGMANWDYSNAHDGASTLGTYAYAYSMHNCTMRTSTGAQIAESTIGHHNGAITIEKGTMDGVFIYANHIKGYPYGVIISSASNNNNSFSNIGIFNNLFENIGYSDYAYTWGIGVLLENNGGYSTTMTDIYFGNNTITGGSGYNYNGIRWVANGTATNVSIHNNIIYGWDQGAVYIPIQGGESASFNGLNITYNCLNSNGANTINISSSISLSSYNITTGNITSNPDFVGASDFHLDTGSPCIAAGVAPALNLDLEGRAWYDPPSMGCYEYTSSPIPPETLHTYYVKNGGDDEADGKSDANAWATIARVNSASLAPGDSVVFKRGDTWREQRALDPPSGSSAGVVYFGAYGTGAKPLLLASKQEMSTGDWTVYSGNVWQNTDASFTANVGNLIFNNEAAWGNYELSLGAVDTQGDFYFDVTANRLYLYSTSNPALYYSNIECALDRPIIQLHSSEDYIIIENLDCRYSGGHGFSAYPGCTNITIRDCDFSWIGGGMWENWAARYGNGIQFWGSASNILIERNRVSQIMDAGITFQYDGASCTYSNCQVRTNIMDKCEYSFEFFIHNATGTITNVFFQNNTCTNAGGGWGHFQRPDANDNTGYDFLCSDIDLTVNSLYIRNNIFQDAHQAAVRFFQSADLADTHLDYNLYDCTNLGSISGSYYTSIAAWRTASSQEAHGLQGDPLFVSSSDWHLTAGSPAIAAGYNVGYTTDFDLENFSAPPSMGAYEYLAGGEPPEEPKPGTIIWRYARKAGKFLMKFGQMVKRPVLIPPE